MPTEQKPRTKKALSIVIRLSKKHETQMNISTVKNYKFL